MILGRKKALERGTWTPQRAQATAKFTVPANNVVVEDIASFRVERLATYAELVLALVGIND